LIIGLSGYAQSGKDTVAELLCLNYGFKRIAFADAIREGVVRLNPMLDDGIRVADLVEDYGWDVAKGNTEVRRLLQVFGTEVGRSLLGSNVWTDVAFKQIDAEPNQRWVIPDVRFENEAQEILNRNGDVWRHNHAPVNHHTSEHAMDRYVFKHVIYNDGTLDDLSDEVFMLAKKLGL
jgi:hypothetical protein